MGHKPSVADWNKPLWSSVAPYYQTRLTGFLEIKLPSPHNHLRLVIFHPEEYPYLWLKYTDGLQKSYRQLGVESILSETMLRNPAQTSLAFLLVSHADCIAGVRVHGPFNTLEQTSAWQEMAQTDTTPMQAAFELWVPDGVAESKGLWLESSYPDRRSVLQLMSRCATYGPLLLNCRYAVGTAPDKMFDLYVTNGYRPLDGMAAVPYPSPEFNTRFVYMDAYAALENSSNTQRQMMETEWPLIMAAKLQLAQPADHEVSAAVVLDEQNPFHAGLVEGVLQGGDYRLQEALPVLEEELDKIKPPLSEALQEESARWVLYPWRKIAVHLAGPRTFRRLRLDRNRNKITLAEQHTLSKLSVGVIGLSTGHVIAHTLAMEGLCGHLRLADFDTLELSNLNRIPGTVLDLGLNKAVSTARRIAELDPYVRVEVIGKGLTDDNIHTFLEGLDVVVEECDSLDMKLLVREAAAKRGIPVLMATSDSGMLDVERFDQEPDRPLFHGLTWASAAELRGLSRRDKAGYAMEIIEGEFMSPRLAASMAEIDHTVSTWPQLASDVTLGAVMVGAAVRRIGLKLPTPSARIRLDMDALLEAGQPPQVKALDLNAPVPEPQFRGTSYEDIQLAARYAPSPGNIQPWRLVWEEGVFCIGLDKALTTSMDVHWRGAYTALGAATFNAEVAASRYGVAGEVELFPAGGEWVSTLRIGAGSDPQLASFFPHLLTRSTNRRIGRAEPVGASIRNALQAVMAQHPKTCLRLLTEADSLVAYADFAAESDRLRHLCRHLHQEMVQELVWPGQDSLEQGIDVRTLELPDKDLNQLALIRRADVMAILAEWDAGQALGEYGRERMAQASGIAAVTIQGSASRDYVQAGRAMQHFWLQAEMLGLAVQPISPIVLYANNADDVDLLMKGHYQEETLALRQRMNELLGLEEGENPVIIVRLTVADAPSVRSARRG